MKRIIFGLICLASPASASIWDGDISITQKYGCLGLDGVPIGEGSAVAAACCSNGELIANPPDTCFAGFVTIGPSSAQSVGDGVNAGQNSMNHANDVQEATPMLAENTAPQSTDAGYTQGEGAATIAGASFNANGNAIKKGKSALNSGAMALNGGASGAAATGLALGQVGGTSGLKSSSDGASAEKGNGSTYGDADGSGGANGKKGSGDQYASLGSGGAGVGIDGNMNELGFGDGKGAGGDGTDGSGLGEDGEAVGSANDPSNYFEMIDKSANIFKIVSARYMKKKSLWKVQQKPAEDLKPKKI